jgi:K+-transporting ATPase c subunit
VTSATKADTKVIGTPHFLEQSSSSGLNGHGSSSQANSQAEDVAEKKATATQTPAHHLSRPNFAKP